MEATGMQRGREPPRKRHKATKDSKGHSQQRPAQADEQPSAHAPSHKRRRKQKKHKHQQATIHADIDDTVAAQPNSPGAQAAPRGDGRGHALPAPASNKRKGKGSLLEQMRARLQGGRFRWLNETLYTTGGAAALELMQREPELMQQYHEGFREQTKGWPRQPVDQAIDWLQSRPASWVVADLGCGDAKIAATVAQKVHSFDLTVTAPGVVACNMADVPLSDASVDAAIFCLSLMGTDYGDFLAEAQRILKPGGWLWIAEVQSRFMDDNSRNVLPEFLAALKQLGFNIKRKDTSNSHFLVLELQRHKQQRENSDARQQQPDWPGLRACQYKKR